MLIKRLKVFASAHDAARYMRVMENSNDIKREL